MHLIRLPIIRLGGIYKAQAIVQIQKVSVSQVRRSHIRRIIRSQRSQNYFLYSISQGVMGTSETSEMLVFRFYFSLKFLLFFLLFCSLFFKFFRLSFFCFFFLLPLFVFFASLFPTYFFFIQSMKSIKLGRHSDKVPVRCKSEEINDAYRCCQSIAVIAASKCRRRQRQQLWSSS